MHLHSTALHRLPVYVRTGERDREHGDSDSDLDSEVELEKKLGEGYTERIAKSTGTNTCTKRTLVLRTIQEQRYVDAGNTRTR